MKGSVGWWLLVIAVIAGLVWWSNRPAAKITGDQTQERIDAGDNQLSTPSENAVSNDLKVTDTDANSIDFTNDFSPAELNDLLK